MRVTSTTDHVQICFCEFVLTVIRLLVSVFEWWGFFVSFFLIFREYQLKYFSSFLSLPDFTQAHEGQPSERLGPSFRSWLQVLIHREVDGQVSIDGLVSPSNFIP